MRNKKEIEDIVDRLGAIERKVRQLSCSHLSYKYINFAKECEHCGYIEIFSTHREYLEDKKKYHTEQLNLINCKINELAEAA